MDTEKLTHDLDPSTDEKFIKLNSVKYMVLSVISERLDETGVVKPEVLTGRMVRDNATGKEYASGPKKYFSRRGYLLPKSGILDVRDKEGNDYKAIVNAERDVLNDLYNNLTARKRKIRISPAEKQRLSHQTEQLEQTAHAAGYEIISGGHQDALHIRNPEKHTGLRDFSNTRVYVSGGEYAAQIANDVLSDPSIDVDYTKVWLTGNVDSDGQSSSRIDSPIFIVSTYAQLESVFRKLKLLKQQGRLPVVSRAPFAGAEIASLPGVTIGQEGGRNFNGNMRDLFGPSIAAALSEHNVPTGQKLSNGWLSTVSELVRSSARAKAVEYGVNPAHHAFCPGEPVDEILAAANRAAA